MKSLLVLIVTLTAVNGQSGLERFLVLPKTITATATVTTTTTTTTSIKTSCASLLSASVACRRRRYAPIMYVDENIEPSAPQVVEATAAPVEMARAIVDASAESSPTEAPMTSPTSLPSPVSIQPSMMENTAGMAEVHICNLDQVCQARAANPFFGVGLGQLFGISVVYSTTSTLTSTVTSTVTTVTLTNTFVISSCTPSPFPFSICPSSG